MKALAKIIVAVGFLVIPTVMVQPADAVTTTTVSSSFGNDTSSSQVGADLEKVRSFNF